MDVFAIFAHVTALLLTEFMHIGLGLGFNKLKLA